MFATERTVPTMRGPHEKSILTIAGSDSSSGAGVQSDIKTAAALGVYATCAITCVTAQNTREFSGVQAVAPDIVSAQVQAVFDDIAPDAVKVGMLPNAAAAKAVGCELAVYEGRGAPVVTDPVLAASTGGAGADLETIEALHLHVLAHTTLLTPNVPEAEVLAGVPIEDDGDVRRAADVLFSAGVGAVLVKGGHSLDPQYCIDRLFIGDESWDFTAPRLPGEYHGTGCILSSAIACHLARGAGLVEAVRRAHDFTAAALKRVHTLGGGSKLVDQLGFSNGKESR